MAKIEIEVKKVGSEITWKEEYVIDGVNPFDWAKATIDNFNATLRADESPRELVGVTVLDESEKNTQHKWTKTNLLTIVRGSSVYDTMKCEKCGITGKRHGLDNRIMIDSKYKAKK
ncbi:hypothetical protein H9650_00040 [Psychrobacillus sp. Sa2BUA9]|uniref:Uncharacterized protein n=1 Tax=Psychrobacillus faecigallinarum TaxID=2762235 RepID=A0ABR8R400_9BACI|nr:hypothetical protein [Psychrobacillus faecigallinarum]MBD7942500.1 hypothetical protein [Psychrobacillus faecigallinarum]